MIFAEVIFMAFDVAGGSVLSCHVSGMREKRFLLHHGHQMAGECMPCFSYDASTYTIALWTRFQVTITLDGSPHRAAILTSGAVRKQIAGQ